jgi:hypothetical protein
VLSENSLRIIVSDDKEEEEEEEEEIIEGEAVKGEEREYTVTCNGSYFVIY